MGLPSHFLTIGPDSRALPGPSWRLFGWGRPSAARLFSYWATEGSAGALAEQEDNADKDEHSPDPAEVGFFGRAFTENVSASDMVVGGFFVSHLGLLGLAAHRTAEERNRPAGKHELQDEIGEEEGRGGGQKPPDRTHTERDA